MWNNQQQKKHHAKRSKKTLDVMFLDFFKLKICQSLLKQLTSASLFYVLLGKPNLSERLSFHNDMFNLKDSGLDMNICIVNAMILIKKYLVKLFRKYTCPRGKY